MNITICNASTQHSQFWFEMKLKMINEDGMTASAEGLIQQRAKYPATIIREDALSK